jgi:AcrR family transcriptional regulator
VVDRNGKSQQIMQAAERLFTSRRFHEITMEDVAREGGVGKGTIYRYFRDKDDLFFQTAMSGFDELCELLRRKVPGHALFAEQMLIACRQISRFFERRRQLSRMMQSEEGRMSWGAGQLHQRWLEHRKRLVAAVAEMVQKGVSEGEVRADIAPEVLATFLLGMLRTRGRDLCDVPQAMRQHEVVVELFVRGVGLRGTVTDGTRDAGRGSSGDGRNNDNDHGPATAQDHATRPVAPGVAAGEDSTKATERGVSEGKA